jgi:predicted RNA-binding protein YlqC (UPF0109 family)
MSEVAVEREDFIPLEGWEILQEITMALVSKPDQVWVAEQTNELGAVCYTIHVAPEDRGKVIGKNGETVSMLRKLLGRIAASQGKRIHVEVADASRRDTRRHSGTMRRIVAA